MRIRAESHKNRPGTGCAVCHLIPSGALGSSYHDPSCSLRMLQAQIIEPTEPWLNSIIRSPKFDTTVQHRHGKISILLLSTPVHRLLFMGSSSQTYEVIASATMITSLPRGIQGKKERKEAVWHKPSTRLSIGWNLIACQVLSQSLA